MIESNIYLEMILHTNLDLTGCLDFLSPCYEVTFVKMN